MSLKANLPVSAEVGDVIDLDGFTYYIQRETGRNLNTPAGNGVREVVLQRVAVAPVAD